MRRRIRIRKQGIAARNGRQMPGRHAAMLDCAPADGHQFLAPPTRSSRRSCRLDVLSEQMVAAQSADQFALPPLFLQAARNFLRSLPWSPLASACFEHSSETALRSALGLAMGLALGAGADFAAGAAAGAVVWADADPASSSAATAVATVMDEILIMGSPVVGGTHTVALRC